REAQCVSPLEAQQEPQTGKPQPQMHEVQEEGAEEVAPAEGGRVAGAGTFAVDSQHPAVRIAKFRVVAAFRGGCRLEARFAPFIFQNNRLDFGARESPSGSRRPVALLPTELVFLRLFVAMVDDPDLLGVLFVLLHRGAESEEGAIWDFERGRIGGI